MQVFFQFVGIICKLKPCLETLQLICEENLWIVNYLGQTLSFLPGMVLRLS